jgi:hypothetical protein
MTQAGAREAISVARAQEVARGKEAVRADERLIKAKEVEVANRPPDDRPRHTADDVGYTTPGAADARAAELLAESGLLNERGGTLSAQAQRAASAAEALTVEGERLTDLAVHLPAADAVPAPAFDGGMDQARAKVAAASGSLALAEEALGTALEGRADLAAQALRCASSSRYSSLGLQVKARLLEGDAAVLGPAAGALTKEIELRAGVLTQQLSRSEQDARAVTTVLASHVTQILHAVDGAARASRIPPGLGEMSGQQFFTINFEHPDASELASRVGQEIATLLDNANHNVLALPTGEAVLKRCVHAAVGVRSFRAAVLKPNEHLLVQRVPVVDVGLFSDGEKLTTCVLLFCAFARMRQVQRGTSGEGTGDATGTLILDNPFGQASGAELVALQLGVAAAQRVHLVYATGLEDMGALLQFRRIVRLRNRRPQGSTDGHLHPGTDTGHDVSAVSVARPDAPVPPALIAAGPPAESQGPGA